MEYFEVPYSVSKKCSDDVPFRIVMVGARSYEICASTFLLVRAGEVKGDTGPKLMHSLSYN